MSSNKKVYLFCVQLIDFIYSDVQTFIIYLLRSEIKSYDIQVLNNKKNTHIVS